MTFTASRMWSVCLLTVLVAAACGRRAGEEMEAPPAARAGDSSEWWVLDGDGEPRHSFRAPGTLEARAVTDRFLWAAEADELGGPFLVRYRLDR